MTQARQLEILLQIDQISDEASTEAGLTLQLVTFLTEAIDVDLGAFSLPDVDEDGIWKLQAVSDRKGVLEKISLSQLSGVDAKAKKLGNGKVIHEKLKIEGKSVYVVAIPQSVNGELLGVLLMAKMEKKFVDEELEIIKIASTRMDSALKHIQIVEKLRQETKALRTIMLVDRIRDTSSSMDELLDLSLTQVTNVIEAQVGFIMLYDTQGNRLQLRALIGKEFITSEKSFKDIYKFADESIQSGGVVQWTISKKHDLQAGVGVPLILKEKVVGVLGVINPLKRNNFSKSDRQLLEAIASQMDTAIFERLETQRIREVFGRNVGDKVMDRLLQISDRNLLEGDRVEITILFSDIRGFTSVSAVTDVKIMEQVINQHFDAMTDVILKHEGTLDKFLGDGIMAFFNAPERQQEHASIAVKTALAMQKAHQELMSQWEAQGLPEMPIGIGIATGEVIVGNFGSQAHAEYSAIGSRVNLAARFCGDAEGDQILIDKQTYEYIKDDFDLSSLPSKELKGFSDPLPVWQVNYMEN